MNLEEIREKVAKNGYSKQTLRQAWLAWLTGENGDLHFDTGLTLMPRKVLYKHGVDKMRGGSKNIYRHLNKTELEAANKRFIAILNKLVFKQGYRRLNMRLDVVAVIEGERELGDLHTHFALKRPEAMRTNDFARLVLKALLVSGDFEIENNSYDADNDCIAEKYRYKLDIIDSGWMSYITKMLNGKDFNNLYLP